MKFFKFFFVAAILLVAACKPAKYPDLKDGLYADIETNKGDILIKLYEEDLPLTVSNFVSLAEGENPNVTDSLKGKKYYDGLIFHRVLKDFMIQSGDPLANGTGGPGYKFEDEFPKDSLGNLKYKHDAAGVLSMANGGPGSNGSQFFITHKATPWLDGIHSIFGNVEKGQDIVNAIAQKDTIKKVSIIRVGSKAKGFDAAKVFTTEIENSVLAKQKRIEEAKKPAKSPDLKDGLYADIETNKGDILIKLYEEDLPLTVSNFVSLAEGENPNVTDSLKGKKYYDGLIFHRVLKDFMIQSGDPLANGTGGPGYKFEDEFPKDSLGNLKYKHDAAGVLSMANGGPGSNGSQFFITHKATPWLDGIHSIFGNVEKGQDIVNAIAQKDTIKKVSIIRVGSKAKGFDAAKVFTIENSVLAKQKRIEEAKKAAAAFQKTQGIDDATKTASGLRILTLKKGKGKKFSATIPTTIHYNMMLATGKPIQSTFGGKPYTFTLSQQPMIAGVNEAIVNMVEGEKVRLFIPYNLGYGERAYGPFPEKSDLIFELEIVKVGK